MALFSEEPKFDFIGKRWYAVAVSMVIITIGVVAIVIRGGLPLGIDFSGGTLMVLEFEEPMTEESVRDALAAIDEKVVQQYGDSGGGVLIRLPQAGPEQGASLEEGAEQVIDTLEASGLGTFEVVSRDLVGPVIGQELQQRGISAFFFAMAGILIYVGLRFRFSFGVGAIVAVVHDILITLSLLTLFGIDLSLNVVAAMLTITGYSVNDSIVVFDRVRENLRLMRRDKFDYLVNKSINQTLARTIITSGTTGFAVLALAVFGGEVLRGFSITMLIGVFSGTYSTIFIASSTAIAITHRRTAARSQSSAVQEREPKGSQESPRSRSRRPQRAQRSKRHGRKARAS
jgi:preprotein translocase subunit SecF